MEIDELLKILVCPVCHAELEYLANGKKGFLCNACKLVYPIEDNIPIMLPAEAIALDKWQQNKEA